MARILSVPLVQMLRNDRPIWTYGCIHTLRQRLWQEKARNFDPPAETNPGVPPAIRRNGHTKACLRRVRSDICETVTINNTSPQPGKEQPRAGPFRHRIARPLANNNQRQASTKKPYTRLCPEKKELRRCSNSEHIGSQHRFSYRNAS